jgi:hypothetical protein
VESNSLTVTQAILRSSDCIGVMSGSAGRHAQADGLLRTLPLELAGHELPVAWCGAKAARALRSRGCWIC